MFVALSIPDWPTGAAANDLLALLLEVAPRAAVSPEERVAWLDARSLDPVPLAALAVERLTANAITVGGMAASRIPVVARVAAQHATRTPLQPLPVIASGAERSWLAPLPIAALGGSETVQRLLLGVGITRAGQLVSLSRESVEVRFGREGLALWRIARADDRRLLFSGRPREYPTASLDWTEFSTTDIEQLVFVLHSLLKSVCDDLAERGIGARALEVTLSLENRAVHVERVAVARSTSQRTTWLRLVRRALEKLSLPDRVTGLAVEVAAAGPPMVRQGDLFDLGFASAQAAESAVNFILDLQPDAVLARALSAHPLLERRVAWESQAQVTFDHPLATVAQPPALQPLLLPLPREVLVRAEVRRGFASPVRYTDNGEHFPLTEALGPHCRSGEQWGAAFAREYHQGVRADGTVVLLYRDTLTDQWYLAGWWD
ncbi:MAG TPA: hypothetical protein VGM77_12850 [Gemmatimonadales bacterium]|jgi:protein ImuB